MSERKIVTVSVSGPVGTGKSAIAAEIAAALRANGLICDLVGIGNYDLGGDPQAMLDMYREGVRVEIREQGEHALESRIGGAYEMPDGRSFWIDGPVAREIARRVLAEPAR